MSSSDSESTLQTQDVGPDDAQAWVAAHGTYLFRYALGRVGNRELAEELVQESFVAAWTKRASFQGKSGQRAWLTGILRHKLIDHFRRRARERPVDDLELEDPVVSGQFTKRGFWRNPPKAWGCDPTQLLENHEFWGIFRGCLGGLPEAQARAFVLRELEEVDAQETCQVLQVAPTSLWQLLSRARARLRKCLEAKWFAQEGRP